MKRILFALLLPAALACGPSAPTQKLVADYTINVLIVVTRKGI